MNDQARALVERYVGLVGHAPIDECLSYWAPDGRIEMPYHPDPGARSVVGIEAIRVRFEHARRVMAFIHSRNVDVRMLGTGWRGGPSGAAVYETALCEYAGEGRTVDGHPYRNRYCCIVEVDHGKLRLWREYFDPLVLTRVV